MIYELSGAGGGDVLSGFSLQFLFLQMIGELAFPDAAIPKC